MASGVPGIDDQFTLGDQHVVINIVMIGTDEGGIKTSTWS